VSTTGVHKREKKGVCGQPAVETRAQTRDGSCIRWGALTEQGEAGGGRVSAFNTGVGFDWERGGEQALGWPDAPACKQPASWQGTHKRISLESTGILLELSKRRIAMLAKCVAVVLLAVGQAAPKYPHIVFVMGEANDIDDPLAFTVCFCIFITVGDDVGAFTVCCLPSLFVAFALRSVGTMWAGTIAKFARLI
jgi:hypothetical protein